MLVFQWWPDHHAERVAAIHANHNNEALFLPSDFVWHRVIPCIVGTALLVSLVYSASYVFWVDRMAGFLANNNSDNNNEQPHAQPQRPDDETDADFRQKKRKLCYQWTNLVTNLCFGLAGLYYECTLYTPLHHLLLLHQQPLTVEQTTTGYTHLVYFSAAQIGYQLWSIPLGACVTHEPWPVLVHHMAVIVCASMSGFLNVGFRYWTPFFYGLVELSSVPLAVMNGFKDNPHTLIRRYPAVYKHVRHCFAMFFLTIRILLFVPRQVMFLRDHFLFFTTAPFGLYYQTFMAAVWGSAAFLLALQLYWAVLIVKGLFWTSSKSSNNNNIITSASMARAKKQS